MVRTLSEENKQQILYEWMEENEDSRKDKVTLDGICGEAALYWEYGC